MALRCFQKDEIVNCDGYNWESGKNPELPRSGKRNEHCNMALEVFDRSLGSRR